jgi:hypothetical protein
MTDQAWTQVNAEVPSGSHGTAGNSVGNPSGIPQSFNPLEAMMGSGGNQEHMYQQFTQRFQGAAEPPGGGAGPQALQNMMAGTTSMPTNQGMGNVPLPSFGADQQQNMQTLMMMAYMNQMSRQGQDGDMSGHKAFRRVHKLEQRVYTQPEEVVNQYLTELVDRMGIEVGDAWAVWQYTQKLPGGHNQGLMRAHFHASHCRQLSLRGQHRCAQALGSPRLGHQTCAELGLPEDTDDLQQFKEHTIPFRAPDIQGRKIRRRVPLAPVPKAALLALRPKVTRIVRPPKGKGKGKSKDKDDKGGGDGGLGE